MKKLILLVNLLLIAGMVWAHGPEQNYDDKASSNSFWKQMNTFHGLIHDSTVRSQNTDEGVRLEISSSSDEVVEVIKKEFVENQEDLISYFKDLDIFIEALDNGVALTFSSNDEKKSIQLQQQGNSLIYQYLHTFVIG